MGAEKLRQFFTSAGRGGEQNGIRDVKRIASVESTGKRILVRFYRDIHAQRFAIGPSQVSPVLPGAERQETDVFVTPSDAKRLVDAGEAMFVKNQHGEIISEE